jgi:hypothetical protein
VIFIAEPSVPPTPEKLPAGTPRNASRSAIGCGDSPRPSAFRAWISSGGRSPRLAGVRTGSASGGEFVSVHEDDDLVFQLDEAEFQRHRRDHALGHQQVEDVTEVVAVGRHAAAQRLGAGRHLQGGARAAGLAAGQRQRVADQQVGADRLAGHHQLRRVAAAGDQHQVLQHHEAVRRAVAVEVEAEHQVVAVDGEVHVGRVGGQFEALARREPHDRRLAGSRRRDDPGRLAHEALVPGTAGHGRGGGLRGLLHRHRVLGLAAYLLEFFSHRSSLRE